MQKKRHDKKKKVKRKKDGKAIKEENIENIEDGKKKKLEMKGQEEKTLI